MTKYPSFLNYFNGEKVGRDASVMTYRLQIRNDYLQDSSTTFVQTQMNTQSTESVSINQLSFIYRRP